MVHSGLCISKHAAEALIEVLELAEQVTDLMEAFKHMDDDEITEVKLAKALKRAALLGIQPEHLKGALAHAPGEPT